MKIPDGPTDAPGKFAAAAARVLRQRIKLSQPERNERQYLSASTESVYQSFASLGGERGWLYIDWAWQIRGMLDRLCGGVGMRRGRREPQELRVGDSLDFWRVEMVSPERLIRLRAEMKVPGRAWLEFEARPEPQNETLLLQTAFFEPKGVAWLDLLVRPLPDSQFDLQWAHSLHRGEGGQVIRGDGTVQYERVTAEHQGLLSSNMISFRLRNGSVHGGL